MTFFQGLFIGYIIGLILTGFLMLRAGVLKYVIDYLSDGKPHFYGLFSAMEYGYKQRESGNNIQQARINFSDIIYGRKTK